MNSLLKLQSNFQDYLLNSQNDIFHDIINTEKVSTDVRLSIYGHAYRSRLLEALAANYPILQIYLGHEQFEALGNAYVDSHPSCYRSIRWFGDNLEKFLNENTPYNDFPYLSELAKIEWTMTLVFDAADSHVVTLESMGNIPPACWVDMFFVAHPSARLVHLSWNTIQIWQALSEDELPNELLQSKMPVTWIFWRKNLINHFSSVTEDEACALDAMLKGSSFGDICEVLCAFVDENEVAMRAAALLKGWIVAGFIAEIKY